VSRCTLNIEYLNHIVGGGRVLRPPGACSPNVAFVEQKVFHFASISIAGGAVHIRHGHEIDLPCLQWLLGSPKTYGIDYLRD